MCEALVKEARPWRPVKEGRAERKRRAETLSRVKLEWLKGKALTAEQQQAVRTARTEDEVLAAARSDSPPCACDAREAQDGG